MKDKSSLFLRILVLSCLCTLHEGFLRNFAAKSLTGAYARKTHNLVHSVGIDLGTTFSLVSTVENGKPRLIPIDGSFLVPSMVSYTPNGEVFVGKAAKEQALVNAKNTFSSIKRLIGRTMKEARESDDIAQFGNKRLVPLFNESLKQELVGVECPALRRSLSPVEISSQILKYMLTAAQTQHFHGETIENAVITVPAHFSSEQCQATKQAGLLAGLKKVKILSEPEAAAFAFGLDKERSQLVLVFDLGGGTFDVSVLEVGDGVAEVIATSGDVHLGGDDFDQAVLDWVYTELEKRRGQQIVQNIRSHFPTQRRLRQLCVESKIQLSKNATVSVDLNSFEGCEGVQLSLTRVKFDQLVEKLLARLMQPVREVALMAGVNLPGESGQLSEEDVMEDDDETKQKVDFSSPTEAEFDALQQMKLSQQQGRKLAKQKQKVRGNTRREVRRLQKEMSDQSLTKFPGGHPIDTVILVGGATRMPCIVKLIRNVIHVDPKRYINPDEAVCLGAGLFSGILDGSIENMKILNPFQAAFLRLMAEMERKNSTTDAV